MVRRTLYIIELRFEGDVSGRHGPDILWELTSALNRNQAAPDSVLQ